MAPRLELHTLFLGLVGSDGKAYFQPPDNQKMIYPCIVYQRDNARTEFADNKPYSYTQRYQVTVIDPDPDSEIPGKVAALPLCIFNRFYVADQLNHDVYILYF